MSKPFFSIILPTYNRANLIIKAIQSVLNQTFDDFELIVVNDGSTDNTDEVVKSIEDRRIKYFKKENEERSIARNFGIDKAEGQYIVFLDADDYFLNTHLEKAYKYDAIADGKIIHLGYKIINNRGEIIFQSQNDTTDLEKLPYENIFHCSSLFIPNKIIKKYKFINSKYATISEDLYLWLILASRFEFLIVNECTSIVVEHDNRSLNNLDPNKIKKSYDLVYKYLLNDKPCKLKYGKRLNISAALSYLIAINVCLSNKKYRLALVCLIKSIIYSPKYTITRLAKRVIKSSGN